MGQYENIGADKSAEEILRDFGNTQYQTGFPQVTSYVLAVAQVRSANEAISAQKDSTTKIVAAVEELNRTTYTSIGSQHDCTADIVGAVDALTKSINRASDESGALGWKIIWLTVALVVVGLLQATATAWSYLAWWWHH